MQNDNRDYIYQPTPMVDDGSWSGLVNILLLLFVVCAFGVFLNWAWEGVEPYYLTVVEWRNEIAGWFQSVFG